MTVQELNTFHTLCELERNQLLTILAMSVQNFQLAGFLLTGNRSKFWYDFVLFVIEVTFAPPPGSLTVLISFLLYTKVIDALTVYQ